MGTHAMVLFLVANDHEPGFSAPELSDMVLAVARGELSVEAIAIWIWTRQRSQRSEV